MIVKGDELIHHRQELQKYIDSYWQKAWYLHFDIV
jgi:hypothetical protein